MPTQWTRATIPDVESIWRALDPRELVYATVDLKDGFHHVAVEAETSWDLVSYGLKSTELWRWLVTPSVVPSLDRGSRRVPHFNNVHSGAKPNEDVTVRLERAVCHKAPAVHIEEQKRAPPSSVRGT